MHFVYILHLVFFEKKKYNENGNHLADTKGFKNAGEP